MMFIPRRLLVVVLVVLASIGSADAQLLSSIFGFLTRSFNFLCPIAQPILSSFFNITLPECFDLPEPEPGPAPTKKGKVVAVTPSPVAPPAATP